MGQGRGAVGEVVLSRAYGKQITRSRNRSPRNPRSKNQALQRCALASGSKFAALVKSIVNHSFEAIQQGSASERYFAKMAIRAFRQNLLTGYTTPAEGVPAIYAIKGSPYAACISGIPVSRGSLPPLSKWIEDTNQFFLTDYFSGTGGEVEMVASSAHALDGWYASCGIKGGDQLTLIAITTDLQATPYVYEGNQNFPLKVYTTRITFKKSSDIDWSQYSETDLVILSGPDTNARFDSDVIESIETTLPGAEYTLSVRPRDRDNWLCLSLPTPANEGVCLVAMVRSSVGDDGKIHYSTEFWNNPGDGMDANDIDICESYMDVASANIGFIPLLDHPE